MRSIIERVIRDYGSTVVAVRGEERTTFRAFLQLVTSKSWQNMERAIGPLGEIPRGQYLYLGPADQPIAQADYLQCGDRKFLVRRAEALLFQDEPVYVWGLLVEKGGDDPWNH